jgi:hypothetical protein
MSKRLLMIALLVATLGLATALLRGMARDVLVVPILQLLWGLVDLFERLPQSLVWWVLIFILLVLAVNGLVSRPNFQLPTYNDPERGSRLASWTRLALLARRDSYSRWRMAQRLALLASEVVAQRQGVDLRQARQILLGSRELPAEVRAYLQAGMGAHRPGGRVAELLNYTNPRDPLAIDPAQVIAAIEQIGSG